MNELNKNLTKDEITNPYYYFNEKAITRVRKTVRQLDYKNLQPNLIINKNKSLLKIRNWTKQLMGVHHS